MSWSNSNLVKCHWLSWQLDLDCKHVWCKHTHLTLIVDNLAQVLYKRDTHVIFHVFGNCYHNVQHQHHNLLANPEIVVNCWRHDALPTHIHSLSRPISDNWKMKTWVQSVPFSKNPKSMRFSRNPNLSANKITFSIAPNMKMTCVKLYKIFHHDREW
jgi:hypothetical protein